VEKDDKKHKENNWGFRCKVYGYVPNCRKFQPANKIRKESKASEKKVSERDTSDSLVPWSVDLELCLALSIGRTVRSVIQNPLPSPSTSMSMHLAAVIPAWDRSRIKRVSARAMFPATHMVDLRLAAGFDPDIQDQKVNVEMIFSATQHLFRGRPQMNSSMRDALRSVERTIFHCLLLHTGTMEEACTLMELTNNEKKAGASALSEKIEPIRKRLSLIWDCVHGMITWMIRQSQVYKCWHVLVDAVHEERKTETKVAMKLRRRMAASERRRLIEIAKKELLDLPEEMTLQFFLMNTSGLSAGVASEERIVHALAKMVVDDIEDQDRLGVDSKVKEEKFSPGSISGASNPSDIPDAKTPRVERQISSPVSSGATTQTFLLDISRRVADMASYLRRCRPGGIISLNQENKREESLPLSSSHEEKGKSSGSDRGRRLRAISIVIEHVTRYLKASGAGFITSELIRGITKSRTAQAQDRERVYRVTARTLAATSQPTTQYAILRTIPCIHYMDGLAGCHEDARKSLSASFGDVLKSIARIMQSTSLTKASEILLHRLAIQFCMLHFNYSDAHMVEASGILKALLTVAFSAYNSQAFRVAMSRGLVKNPLAAVASDSLHAMECTSAVTGSNFVQMEVYECKDCGLNNGECCCYICAEICHAGHNVTFKRRSKAFCDCGFTGRCLCMQKKAESRRREEQVVLARLSLVVLRDLSMRTIRWSSHMATVFYAKEATAKCVTRLVNESLTGIFKKTIEYTRHFRTCLPNEVEEKESALRDLIRVGYILMREIDGIESGSGSSVSSSSSSSSSLSPSSQILAVDTVILVRYLAALREVIACGSQNMHRIAIRSILLLLVHVKAEVVDTICRQDKSKILADVEKLAGAKGFLSDLLSIVGFVFQRDGRIRMGGNVALPQYDPEKDQEADRAEWGEKKQSERKLHGDVKEDLPNRNQDAKKRTKSELESLSTKAIAAILEELGVPGSLVAKSSRWHRIEMASDEAYRQKAIKEHKTSAANSRADNYRLVLWRPDGVPVNAYVQQFLELFYTPLMHLSQNSSESSTNSSRSYSMSALRQRLQFGLRQSSWATLLVGTRNKCHDFGLKVAAKGMQCLVEPCNPDICALRNRVLKKHLEPRNYILGGQQALERSAGVSECLQTILTAHAYQANGWAGLLRSIIATEAKHLPELAAKSKVATTATSSASVEGNGEGDGGYSKPSRQCGSTDIVLTRVLGILCVLSGFLCDILRIGGKVKVISESQRIKKSREQGEVDVVSPQQLGDVVSMEQGYNQMRVVFDNDPQMRPTLVHRSKLEGIKRFSDREVMKALLESYKSHTSGEDDGPTVVANIASSILSALKSLPTGLSSTPLYDTLKAGEGTGHEQDVKRKHQTQHYQKESSSEGGGLSDFSIYGKPLLLGALSALLSAVETPNAALNLNAMSLPRICLQNLPLLKSLRDCLSTEGRSKMRAFADPKHLNATFSRALVRSFDITCASLRLLNHPEAAKAAMLNLSQLQRSSHDKNGLSADGDAKGSVRYMRSQRQKELPYLCGDLWLYTKFPMPTRWNRDSAPHCLFSHASSRVVQYAGGHSRRLKANKGDDLPVTITADEPVPPYGILAYYFEIKLLPSRAIYDPTVGEVLDKNPKRGEAEKLQGKGSDASGVEGKGSGISGSEKEDPDDEKKSTPAAKSDNHREIQRYRVAVGLCTDGNASQKKNIHGWAQGSLIYMCNTGQKCKFMAKTKPVGSDKDRMSLDVDDLLDVKDSVGKWEPAIVIGASGAQIRVHYINWDTRYDEWLDRSSERICEFRTHTVGPVGQLFGEDYDENGGASTGDVIGCLWNKSDLTLTFTKNGKAMGCAFTEVEGPFFPAVTLYGSGVQVAVNFGQTPFRYIPETDAGVAPVVAKLRSMRRGKAKQGSSSESWRLPATVDKEGAAANDGDTKNGAIQVQDSVMAKWRSRYTVAADIIQMGVLADCTLEQVARGLELHGDSRAEMIEWAFANPAAFSGLKRSPTQPPADAFRNELTTQSTGESKAGEGEGDLPLIGVDPLNRPCPPASPVSEVMDTAHREGKALPRPSSSVRSEDVDVEEWFESEDEEGLLVGSMLLGNDDMDDKDSEEDADTEGLSGGGVVGSGGVSSETAHGQYRLYRSAPKNHRSVIDPDSSSSGFGSSSTGANGSTGGNASSLIQQQNLQSSFAMGSLAGSLDGVAGEMSAEEEEAEAARSIVHMSHMDNWLSQLEQGLGSSQQLERVQQMLQQLRRLNFGSLAHALMTLPHLRSIPQSVVILQQSRGGESRHTQTGLHGEGDPSDPSTGYYDNPNNNAILSDETSFWSPTAIAGRQTIVQEQLSTVEQSMTGAEPMVGLRVRISATAKKDTLSAESQRSDIFNPATSPWLPDMDHTEGCIGIIRALDSDDNNLHEELGPNLALVEIWDTERSMVSLWWYSVKHLLARTASCQDAYLGLETHAEAESTLKSCLQSITHNFATRVLSKLSPFLVHNYNKHLNSATHGGTVLGPESDEKKAVQPLSFTAPLVTSQVRVDLNWVRKLLQQNCLPSPLPSAVSLRLIKDCLKVSARRLLRLGSVLCTQPITPVPSIGSAFGSVRSLFRGATEPSLPSSSSISTSHSTPNPFWAHTPSQVPQVMDDYLPLLQVMIQKNPLWCCQLLRKAQDLNATSMQEHEYSAKIANVGAAGRSCVVWTKRVEVKDASSLIVAFDRDCRLPSGVLLAFYRNSTCTELVRCFSRHISSQSGSGGRNRMSGNTGGSNEGLCPFTIPSGCVWVRCSVSSQAQSRSSSKLTDASDSANDIYFKFVVSPVATDLSLACWIAHHVMNSHSRIVAQIETLRLHKRQGHCKVTKLDDEGDTKERDDGESKTGQGSADHYDIKDLVEQQESSRLILTQIYKVSIDTLNSEHTPPQLRILLLRLLTRLLMVISPKGHLLGGTRSKVRGLYQSMRSMVYTEAKGAANAQSTGSLYHRAKRSSGANRVCHYSHLSQSYAQFFIALRLHLESADALQGGGGDEGAEDQIDSKSRDLISSIKSFHPVLSRRSNFGESGFLLQDQRTVLHFPPTFMPSRGSSADVSVVAAAATAARLSQGGTHNRYAYNRAPYILNPGMPSSSSAVSGNSASQSTGFHFEWTWKPSQHDSGVWLDEMYHLTVNLQSILGREGRDRDFPLANDEKRRISLWSFPDRHSVGGSEDASATNVTTEMFMSAFTEGSKNGATEIKGQDGERDARLLDLTTLGELALYISRYGDEMSTSPIGVTAEHPFLNENKREEGAGAGVTPANNKADSANEKVRRKLATAMRMDRIKQFDSDTFRIQASHLQRLNLLVSRVLALVDLSNFATASTWCLGSQLERCRTLIFKQVKSNFVDQVLATTASSSAESPTVRVNRIIASNSIGIDPPPPSPSSTTMFGSAVGAHIYPNASPPQQSLSAVLESEFNLAQSSGTSISGGESNRSSSSSSANVRKSRHRSLRRRLFDVHTSLGETIFGQAFQQLKDVNVTRLRPAQPRGTSPHVALNIVFEGEQALGQAGPYRAFFSDICRELQQYRGPGDQYPIKLFMPTPNNLHRIGEDRDRYMPHPSMQSIQHIELFQFIGRMMGIAMRTNIIMSLDLATLLWKQLSGQALSLSDLRRVDEAFVKNVLEPLLPQSPLALDRESFAKQYGPEVIAALTKSDQTPLFGSPVKYSDSYHNIPGLFTQGPIFEDRQKLFKLLLRTRLFETRVQTEAIRRGFCTIVPEQLLSILTWQELEERICGTRDIDIELLKRHTEYGPDVDQNAPHIRYLWKTLEGFTQQQLRRFVKFAFAQERLPSTDEGFSHPKIRMLIKSSRHAGKRKNEDDALPHADTCFFNVEIPAYSSEEIMRKRLTTVVNMDWGMSGDDIGAEQSLQSVLVSGGSGYGRSHAQNHSTPPVRTTRTTPAGRNTRTSSAQTAGGTASGLSISPSGPPSSNSGSSND